MNEHMASVPGAGISPSSSPDPAPYAGYAPMDCPAAPTGPTILGLLTFATALVLLGGEMGFPAVSAALRPVRSYAYFAIIVAVLLMPPNRPLPRPSKVDLFALAFLGLAALSTTYSNFPNTTLMRAASVGLQYTAVFWALRYHAERGGTREIESALLAVVVLVLALAPVYLRSSSIAGAFEQGRYRGILANPNGVGLICAIMLPLAYGRLLERRTAWSVLAFGVILLSLVLSGSRNGVFASVLGLSYITYKWSAGERALTVASVAALVLVLGGTALISAVPLIAPQMYQRFLPGQFGTGSGRLVAWDVAVRLVNARLLWGHGFGTEEYALLGLRLREFQGSYFHNSYLGLSYQVGVVGAALLFLPLLLLLGVSLVRPRGRPSDRAGTPYEAVLLVGLFASGFESWIYSAGNGFSFPFWTCVMLLVTVRARLPSRRGARGLEATPPPAFPEVS